MFKTFLLTLALGLSLNATMVTFDTNGTLSCSGGAIGCGTDTVLIGNVIVHYSGQVGAQAQSVPGSFINLGAIDIGCWGGGTACGPTLMPADLGLVIHIVQVFPLGAGDIPSGDIDGRISGTASLAAISWNMPATVSIGAIQYGVLNSPLGLVPPSQENCPPLSGDGPCGRTTIQGFVMERGRGGESQTPEPATYSMVGAALIGVAMIRRKRSV